jgi:hypothetical protein
MGDEESMLRRTILGARQLAIAAFLLLTVASAIALIYFENPRIRNDILTALSTSLLQLAALGIVGVYVKYLFDRHQEDRKRIEVEQERERQSFEMAKDRERLRREAADALRSRLLERLGKCEDALLKGRVAVSAKRSLQAYDEMARRVTNAQITVVYLQDEVSDTPAVFPNGERINANLDIIARYLEAIVTEYEKQRSRIEQANSRDLQFLFRDLPLLGDLIHFGSAYQDRFSRPYANVNRAVRTYGTLAKRTDLGGPTVDGGVADSASDERDDAHVDGLGDLVHR